MAVGIFQDILDGTFWARVFFTILCGFMIGLERQVRGKPVGIRTSTMICMGTMLFIYTGIKVSDGTEILRILGQVVTGIGFLGAGVIITRGDDVSGVTSASVVWLLAGIGAAIGFQHYGTALAITLVALFILIVVQWMEKAFKGLQRGVHRQRKED